MTVRELITALSALESTGHGDAEVKVWHQGVRSGWHESVAYPQVTSRGRLGVDLRAIVVLRPSS